MQIEDTPAILEHSISTLVTSLSLEFIYKTSIHKIKSDFKRLIFISIKKTKRCGTGVKMLVSFYILKSHLVITQLNSDLRI